jgi:hypothetical protein
LAGAVKTGAFGNTTTLNVMSVRMNRLESRRVPPTQFAAKHNGLHGMTNWELPCSARDKCSAVDAVFILNPPIAGTSMKMPMHRYWPGGNRWRKRNITSSQIASFAAGGAVP